MPDVAWRAIKYNVFGFIYTNISSASPRTYCSEPDLRFQPYLRGVEGGLQSPVCRVFPRFTKLLNDSGTASPCPDFHAVTAGNISDVTSRPLAVVIPVAKAVSWRLVGGVTLAD
jgi:hypothetical protein